MGSVDKVAGGWRARWRTPEGDSRSKNFKRKVDAESHVTAMEHSKLAGGYVDALAGRVPFRVYAEQWLAAQTFDQSSREATEHRLRLHVLPVLGDRQVRLVKPSTIQQWLRGLEGLAPTTRAVIFTNVSAVFAAAVDDELIAKNPCLAPSVRRPVIERRRVVPWTVDQAADVIDALPDRYRIVGVLAAGLGLRQGEVFGLAPDDVDFLQGTVQVRRQVKLYRNGRLAFALPKGRKTREVPLPSWVRDALAAHLAKWPARTVRLPWGDLDGDLVDVDLVVSSRESKAIARTYFNRAVWKPALERAGIEPTRENGCHALRHHYASVLLDAGESVKALSEFLGHSDPGFTLRVYTHLMPSSHERTRRAIDDAWSRVAGRPADAG